MSTIDQNQTVTSSNQEEFLEVRIIDQKFQDIKNRLKEQGSETSTQKNIQYNKDFCMEPISAFEKKDYSEQISNSMTGAVSKSRSELSEKNIFSEHNKNNSQNECHFEFPKKSIDKSEKENHHRLSSYQSSIRQVSVISENAEYQQNIDDDHVSVKIEKSQNSKLSSTYVVYPMKEDSQSNSSLSRVQRDIPNVYKNNAHSSSNSRRDGMISFSNNDENQTKYNYMNEAQSLFKDEDSKQFTSEADQLSQALNTQRNIKFSKILTQEEIKVLDKDAKQDYIIFLKNEINQELKREMKFKQLQEEVILLNKNYRLEKELQQTEQDNRKLQIWILEDKIQQIDHDYEQKINEKNIFDNQMKELRDRIVQTNLSQNEKEDLINQTKIQIQNDKSSLIHQNQQNNSLFNEQNQLKIELENQNQILEKFILQKVEYQEVNDQNQKQIDDFQKQIENIKLIFQQKETQIFGCKKEMRRIQDDIVEANQIKATIKEEQDMNETQLCFLKKQKLIFERDIENLKKKQKFEEEFIHYGDKNNNQLFEQIKQNRHYFENQKEQKYMFEKEIETFISTIELVKQQTQYVQQQNYQVEENINQIIEVTKQGDEIFKNEDHYEETRQMLLNLLRPNFDASNQNNHLNQPLQVQKNILKSQKSESFLNNNMRNQNNNTQNEGSIHIRCRSNIEDRLNITNIKESLSAKLKQINQDQYQNEEEIQTKRVFSDKALSPTDNELKQQFGFMGLGKSQNGGKSIICNVEYDEISQKTEDENSPQVHFQNQNKCLQNHQRIDLNNIDKLSKIESQQKLQSPFTLRSILTSQNGARQDTKQVNEISQKNMDMPLQVNCSKSKQQPIKQTSQRVTDLKSFLTKNDTDKNEENQHLQKNRLNMVNQIRDCSPLKQILPVSIFMKAQQKQQDQKKQTKSKDEKKQQKYFINDIENQKYVEIKQKNEQLKKGEIKQIIYLDDNFFNQINYEQPVQKIKTAKQKVSSYDNLNKNNFEQHKNSRDQYQQYQDMYIQTEQQHQKSTAYLGQSENQKKSVGLQFQSFQSKKEYEDFLQFQKGFCSSNTDFKDFKSQQEYVHIQAQPFRKKLSYNTNQQEQFYDQNNKYSQIAQMYILNDQNTQNQFSDQANEKYVVYQEMKQSKSGVFSQNYIREKSNGSISKYVTPQVFSTKKLVTDSKIDSYKEKPPIYNQFQSRKILSSSQVENQYKKEDQKYEQIKVAPLRKSITKRRDDSFNISKKSEPQSINNQSSNHFGSINLQNPNFYKYYNRKNTPNYEVISIQSQKPVPIPPIQTQKTSYYLNQQINDDNLSKSNLGYDKFLNKDILTSQLSTRSLYVAKPKHDLHKQNYYEITSYENEQAKVNSELNKRRSFPINESNLFQAEKQYSHDNNNITFKKSTTNNSLNKINYNSSIHNNETYQPSNIIQSQMNLNLKSNFAKKNLDIFCVPKTDNANEKKGHISQRTENKSIISQQFENQMNKKQSYSHFGLRVNTQSQSQSSIQNNSYQNENGKQDHEFSLIHKDQNYKNEPISNNTKFQNAAENYDKYFKIQSPEQKKNNQTIQAFTPYYQNNLTQSHFASIEQNAEKNYPSISKCPIAIVDQIESRQLQNNYAITQPFVKSQIQFKSNFGKQKFEQNQESQNIGDNQFNNIQFQKTPIKEKIANSLKSSPSGIQKSRQSKLSQFLKPNTCQIDEFSNNQFEQKSQNQSHLEKMQYELKLLQAQIGDGIISQNANTPKEPKSVLVGNLKKRERMENDLCFDRSELYGEQMDVNSQRHHQIASIDFLIKEQAPSSQITIDNSRKDSQSDITTKTNQTKTIQDQQYILQDQNIKVTQGSVAGRSVNNTYIEMTDNRNMHNTVEELSEEQLRSQSDEMNSNYENGQDNTYLSLKDQADIISQLRSCKAKF